MTDDWTTVVLDSHPSAWRECRGFNRSLSFTVRPNINNFNGNYISRQGVGGGMERAYG